VKELLDVGEVLGIARHFLIWDTSGPYGDLGSFNPIKAELKNGIWEIKAEYSKKYKKFTAIVKIEDRTRRVIGFETVGGQ